VPRAEPQRTAPLAAWAHHENARKEWLTHRCVRAATRRGIRNACQELSRRETRLYRQRDKKSRLPWLTGFAERAQSPTNDAVVCADAVQKPNQAIAAKAEAAKRGDQICEAEFYLGEMAYIRGDKAEAESAFTRAKEICPKTFIEYEAAVNELAILKK
jgi:hypothetical protein